METQLNILKLGARMVRNFVSSIKRAEKTPPKLAKKKNSSCGLLLDYLIFKILKW